MVDTGTETLEYIKEAVVTICRNNSDKFEGHSKGSTGWFNPGHKFVFKQSTLEPDFY